MKAIDQVSGWLRQRRGKLCCDACIASQIGLNGRRAVWRTTKVLEKSNDFHRQKGLCPVCHERRLLIRAI